MDEAAAIIKPLIWDSILKNALQKLFAAVPLLGWGPIGYVVTWIAFKISDRIFNELKMAVKLEMIELRNETAKHEFFISAVALRHIALTEGVNSDNFKRLRDENARLLGSLIAFSH